MRPLIYIETTIPSYLLTWNCRHLANANKARRLEELNEGMGLSTPRLITPHQLYPWEELA